MKCLKGNGYRGIAIDVSIVYYLTLEQEYVQHHVRSAFNERLLINQSSFATPTTATVGCKTLNSEIFCEGKKNEKKISASDFNSLMSGEVKVKIKMQTINLLSLLFALSNGISWKLNEQRGCRILRLHIFDHINQMVVIADTMVLVLEGIQITRDTRGGGGGGRGARGGRGEGSINCHVNF